MAHLSQASWSQLSNLNTSPSCLIEARMAPDGNDIDKEGAAHLSQASWSQLLTLDTSFNGMQWRSSTPVSSWLESFIGLEYI